MLRLTYSPKISNRLIRPQVMSMMDFDEKSLFLIQMSQSFFKIANDSPTLETLLPAFVHELKKVTECGFIGIRLLYEGGAFPIKAQIGLSDEFLSTEGPLSTTIHDGLCTRVMMQELNGLQDYCTSNGSFYSNRLQQDLDSISKDVSFGLRKKCCLFGINSLALVPIMHGGEPLGLLYIADEQPNMISNELVTLFENIGLHLAPAIKRFQIERNLIERTQALERSNKELEQFAFAASHDLQEPIRMVSLFMDLLEKTSEGQLNAVQKNYLHLAVDGANRMRQMITDLLEYSRIQGTAKDFSVVDLNDVLQKALENLAGTLKETEAILTSDRLPSVYGNFGQLIFLFQHLIGNAIKFREQLIVPRIHVGAITDMNDAWHLYVQDNGIGIDPKYFDKIFVIFRRLNPYDKYPGSGFGLSMCRKIVEIHNGLIWVESVLNNGSTFHFTIKNLDKDNGS